MRSLQGLWVLIATANALHAGEAPSYAKHVRPILIKYCLECHNAKSAKGGLDLETHKALLDGADSGPVLKPGKADESALVLSVEGKGRSAMPPKSKTLRPTQGEIATLRAWVNAGAKDDSAAIKLAIPDIKPKRAIAPPVKALAYAADGSRLAAVEPGKVGGGMPITALATAPPDRLAFAAGLPGRSGGIGGIRSPGGPDDTVERQLAAAHADLILDLAFSPDGGTLASGSYDTKVKLWDAATGKLLHALKDHSDAVYGVSFHPGGKMLATCAADRTVKVWDVASAKLLLTLGDSTDWLYAVAWHPNGKHLAAGGVDKSIRVWEISDQGGKIVHSVFAHEGPVLKLIYDRDGKTLYSLGEDRIVKAWDAERMVERKVYDRQPETVLSMALRPDGKQLALGRYDGAVVLVDTATGAAGTVAGPAGEPKSPPAKRGGAAQPGRSQAESGNEKKDPFPRVNEREPNNSPGQAQPITLPASVVGGLEKTGDVDFYRINVKAGQQLGVEIITAAIGSKVDAALQLVDGRGRVLAESNDGVLAHVFAEAGAYTISVRDREFRGGADMPYRLRVGEIPVVTALFPLGGQRGTETEISVAGVFLTTKSVKVKVPADAAVGGKIAVPVASPLGPPRGRLTIVAGEFPEVRRTSGAVAMLPVPGTGDGVLLQPNQVDDWRFTARKGRRLILETEAQRLGAPLDTMLEILDGKGNPVPRAVLRCQAKTFVTFRDHDNVAPGIRIDAWNDLAMRDYIYVGGSLLKIHNLPPNPDADCAFVSTANGRRLGFLDTTPTHHAQNTPMYKVTIHPPGATFPPNGFPVFTLNYRNDDGGPDHGRDSRIFFDPPADGDYLVRVRDVRGQFGPNCGYRLTVRPPRPDFNVRFSPTAPVVWKQGAVPLTIAVDRLDGYDGPIQIRFDNVPPGFSVPATEIQAGEVSTAVALYADANAAGPAKAMPLRLLAEAVIDGRKQVKVVAGETPKVAENPEIIAFTDEAEVTIRPGRETKVLVHVERRGGFTGRVPIDVKGLPYGVRVLDIGLNGILITERETRRAVVLYAEPWVEPTEHPFVILARREGKNSEHAAKSVLLKVTR